MDRFKPTKYDKIQDDETAEAVEQAHIQNTDTKLDEGGASEVAVADIKDAVDIKHSHDNKVTLDIIEEALTSALKTAYDDAVTKAHEHSNKATLDLIEEAFTSALKTAYDSCVTNEHTHANKVTLDAIEEAFTTALKDAYDSCVINEHTHANKATLDLIEEALTSALKTTYDDAVTKAHTQGTDQKLDEGGVNEVAVADVKDAVTHKDLTDNPHTVTSAQVGAYTQAEVNTLVNGAKCIEITLSGNANNYLLAKNTTYTVLTSLIFKGTTILGSPTKIKAIIHVKTAAKPGDVRIYDLTNANAICEVTGISSLVPIVVDLGTLSNLPSGEAMFEVQAKDPLADEVYVSGLIIEF